MNLTTKILTASALLALFADSSAAQATWTRQSPLPYPPQLNPDEIAFSATRGYIVGANPGLLETTDGGSTWHERVLTGAVFNEGTYYGATFFGPTHGWIVGAKVSWSNACFRTVDGGATWTQMTSLPDSDWNHVDFVSPTRGWAGAWGALYATSDGGTTWAPQSYGVIDRIDSMNFFDANVGVLSSQGALRRTQNGGQTWTIVHGHDAFAIEWISPSIVIASTHSFGGPDFARSTDAGLTWQVIDVPGVDLQEPVRVDATTVIAGTPDGDLYRSTDAGSTWHKVWNGVVANMNGGTFTSAADGFVLESGNLILRTQDGGQSWSYASSGFGMGFEDVKMFDASRGLVCGGGGTVMLTEDGGSSWIPSRPGWTLSNGSPLMDLSLVAPSFAFASGDDGTLVKTLDGGHTWQGVAAPVGFPNGGVGDYWACSFISPLEGWLGGGYLEIAHTIDGGATWTQQYATGASGDGVYDMDFVDAQHGWAVGSFDGVLRTTDGGASWNYITFPSPSPHARAIDFVTPLVGWAGSTYGWIARSIDGGLTWTRQSIPGVGNATHLLSIQAISVNECWAASSDNGRMFHTTDGGAAWIEVATPFHDPYDGYTGIAVTAGSEVWVVGAQGVVSHLGPVPPLIYCTAKTNSLGCVPEIHSIGVPSASATQGFDVRGALVRNNKNGLLFYGINGPSAIAFQGGTLCVKSPLRRTGAVNAGGNPAPSNDCSGVFAIDMNAFAHSSGPPAPLPALLVPGTTVNCQWWGRDAGFASPNNTTLTDALEYTVFP